MVVLEGGRFLMSEVSMYATFRLIRARRFASRYFIRVRDPVQGAHDSNQGVSDRTRSKKGPRRFASRYFTSVRNPVERFEEGSYSRLIDLCITQL